MLDQSFLCQMDAAVEAIGHTISQTPPVPARCGGRVDESNPGQTRDAHPGEQRSRFVTMDEGRQARGNRSGEVSSVR